MSTWVSQVKEKLLPPREVAKRLGVSVKTLWKWQKRGLIRAVRLPTGKLRYPESEVERIIREGKTRN